MSLFYDKALCDKIKQWDKDDRIHVYPREDISDSFTVIADDGKDHPISLPLVTISKDPNIELQLSTKRSLSYDGKRIGVSAGNEVIKLNAIPLLLTYQIDIYAEHYEEAFNFVRELTFKIVNNPKIIISFEYNGVKAEHVCYMNLLPSITDNSDIEERSFPGQFTRFTLQVELKDAYLFSIPIKEPYTIDGDIEILERKVEVDT